MIITAEPRSDQWNADDFIGGPITFTIAGVKVGTAEQKYDIELVEGQGRAWRPPLTMLRLLIAAWGQDAAAWTGRRVTLYRDESVRFGSDAVGGIRISHMSNLPEGRALTVKLTSTRGRRASHTVEPLPDAAPAPAAAGKQPTPAGITAAFKGLGVTLAQLEARQGVKQSGWNADDVAQLAALGKSIKDGKTTVSAEFETAPEAGDPAVTESESAGEPMISTEQMAAVTDALIADKYETVTDQASYLTDLLGQPIEGIDQLTAAQAQQVLAIFEAN